METADTPKKPKGAANLIKTAPIRVSKDTRRRILAELARLNKKDFGRRVKADDLITKALALLESKHFAQLQDGTLSNADRLERRYADYVKQHGSVAKDAFLGMLLAGEIAMPKASAEALTTGEAGLL